MMRTLMRHLKTYVFRGLLAIIPLALSYFALKILYQAIDQPAMKLAERLFGFSFPGLGLFLVLVILYLLGLVASNVVGKHFFGLIERIMNRIPLIKTTYKVGRQLGSTLALPGKEIFKKALLVEYLKPGMWTLGFVTGSVVDKANEDEILLKVFVPTPPNPTSGTMIVVRESQTRDPGWTIEEAMQAVVSAGIIGPRELR